MSKTKEKRGRWRFGRWMVRTLVVLVAGFALHAVVRVHQITALQDSIERNYELTFNRSQGPISQEAHHLVRDLTSWLKETLDGPHAAEVLWADRIEGVFYPRITLLEVWYPEPIKDSFGSALKRFGGLESLMIVLDAVDVNNEKRMKLMPPLIQSISSIDSLRTLELNSFYLTREDLGRLTDSRIEHLILRDCVLPEDLASQLKLLSTIAKIEVEDPYKPASEFWTLTAEEIRALAEWKKPGHVMILYTGQSKVVTRIE